MPLRPASRSSSGWSSCPQSWRRSRETPPLPPRRPGLRALHRRAGVDETARATTTCAAVGGARRRHRVSAQGWASRIQQPERLKPIASIPSHCASRPVVSGQKAWTGDLYEVPGEIMLTVDQDHDSATRAERVGDGEVARTGSVLHGLARAAYDRIDAVNWSKLKLMLKSPAHYRHNLLQRGGDSDAKRRGRVTHLSVLEPQRFQSDCVVWDGGPRRGKDWEKFKKAHADVEIVTEA